MGTVLKGDISVVENGLKVMSLDNGEREEVHTLKYYGIGINEIMKERQKLGYLKKQGVSNIKYYVGMKGKTKSCHLQLPTKDVRGHSPKV